MLDSFYKDCPILITGGAGFIGSHLTEKLSELGAKVTIVDNLSNGSLNNIANFKKSTIFIKGDIVDFETCLKVTKNHKIIFHLAALISVTESMQNPAKCNDINIKGTFNLLEAARINKVDKFIFSSSCAVYGKTNKISQENDPCDPISIYGYSKLIGEQYCKLYRKIFGINTLSLRYFNVYGPRQNSHGEYAAVVAKFAEQIQNNKPITIYGDGKQTRDFVHVEKVVDANLFLAMLDKDDLNGQAVNIATGKSISLLELFNNLKLENPNYSNKLTFLPARLGDIIYSVACSQKYENLISKLNINRKLH